MIIPARLIKMPALIMCLISSLPDPKITAFGGVATGNINAQLAAKTTAKVSIF